MMKLVRSCSSSIVLTRPRCMPNRRPSSPRWVAAGGHQLGGHSQSTTQAVGGSGIVVSVVSTSSWAVHQLFRRDGHGLASWGNWDCGAPSK